ncbi:MAG: rod shape-determining protein MreD [Gammaproteobacteria bacterium]|jgi:rod shape-determining protein MreD
MSASRWFLAAILGLLALILEHLPLPDSALQLWPAWASLLAFAGSLYRITPSGLGYAWTLGIANDLLSVTPLGQHALLYLLLAGIALQIRRHITHLALPQQALILLLVLLPLQVLEIWIRHLSNQPELSFWIVPQLLLTALCWIPFALWWQIRLSRI